MGGTEHCQPIKIMFGNNIYKPKYEIWCESEDPCAPDPSIPI